MSTRYPNQENYRSDIDGLRAVAVLSVLVFHAFPGRFQGGFIGVDVFFVISGFLISHIILAGIEKNKFSLIGFYSRRVRRIFPALAVVLLTVYSFGWFVLLSAEYEQLGIHILGGAAFISNFVLWSGDGYFDITAKSKPLLHLWSLAVEEQFYIVWPLLLIVLTRSRLNALAAMSLFAVSSFLLNTYVSGSDPVAAFYSPQTRIWELLVGAILARLTHDHPNFPKKATFDLFSRGGRLNLCLIDLQSVVGLGMIAAAFFTLNQESQYPGWWALLPTIGTAVLILAGKKAWINRIFLSNRIMVWFGLISYPLYLWHWPIFSFANIMESAGPSRQFRVAAILISIVLAWATWKFIELPMRYGQHAGKKTILLLVSITLIGYLGYDTYRRDGIESRFPEIVKDLIDYRYDFESDYRAGTCLLGAEQRYTAFDRCKSNSVKPIDSSILLWGDSHAAHLYPGFLSTFGSDFEIIQRTASLCPPILGLEVKARPNCKEINDFVFELVKTKRPSRVVLASNWWVSDWRGIKRTISALQRIGVREIDLIGAIPQWHHPLPRQLLLNFQKDKLHRVPYRIELSLIPKYRKLDRKMSDYAKSVGINFISLTSILCSETDCLARLGHTGETLTVWDQGHLTAYGSRFVVKHFSFKRIRSTPEIRDLDMRRDPVSQ